MRKSATMKNTTTVRTLVEIARHLVCLANTFCGVTPVVLCLLYTVPTCLGVNSNAMLSAECDTNTRANVRGSENVLLSRVDYESTDQGYALIDRTCTDDDLLIMWNHRKSQHTVLRVSSSGIQPVGCTNSLTTVFGYCLPQLECKNRTDGHRQLNIDFAEGRNPETFIVNVNEAGHKVVQYAKFGKTVALRQRWLTVYGENNQPASTWTCQGTNTMYDKMCIGNVVTNSGICAVVGGEWGAITNMPNGIAVTFSKSNINVRGNRGAEHREEHRDGPTIGGVK